jgi:hypothetical protein
VLSAAVILTATPSAAAAAGDKIIVGPGLYGADLSRGTNFNNELGEEAADPDSGCPCSIKLNKPVTILSRDGASSTVIDLVRTRC